MNQPHFVRRWLTIGPLLLLLLVGNIQPSAAESATTAASGAQFTYTGAGYTVTYRFAPNTGTLNDLRVRDQRGFEFYPVYWGGIYEVLLAGERLRPWDARVTKQFLSESNSNGVYTAAFRWSYNGDALDFTVRLWPEQNKLHIAYDSASEKVIQFHLDRSEQTPSPKVVELPYGHNVLFTNGLFVSGVLDHQISNAALIYPINQSYSATSAFYGYGGVYNPLTNGRRHPLREQITVAVSPTLEEVFHYPTNRVSPYKSRLADQVVVDLWRGNFADHQATLQSFANRGLTDLYVLLHRWQQYGYDRHLPTTYPAGNEFGGPTALRQVSALCTAHNYDLALHTNYTEEYPGSPDANRADLALWSDGNPIPGWKNWLGEESNVMKSARSLHYAGIYEPLLHNDYQTNGAFLDVHTAVLPGYRTDYDATIAGAGRQATVLRDYRTLVNNVRTMHDGPVSGEGFGYTTALWAGYVDAIEADPRSAHDIQQNRAGSSVPTLVDYKLRALHHLFVPHGAGYLERFYLGKETGFTVAELERYRATELAFGNAGFISDLVGRVAATDATAREQAINEAIREYCVMKSLQQRYLTSTPITIRYLVNNNWLPVSAALQALLPSAAFDNVDTVLSEQLGMVQITYANGLQLYVNRTANRTVDVPLAGTTYTLPPNGFLAHQGNAFLAYNAIVNGVQRHYICPSEGICNSCPAVPLIKNGDFELGATPDWQTTSVRNRTLITNQGPVASHSGSYFAHLGGVNRESSAISQVVQLPTNGLIFLRYHYQTRSRETYCNRDLAEVRINGRRIARYPLCTAQSAGQWTEAAFNLSRYAGQQVTVRFALVNNQSLPSSFFLDDIALTNELGTQASAKEVASPEVLDSFATEESETVLCDNAALCLVGEDEESLTSDSVGYNLYLPVINQQ